MASTSFSQRRDTQNEGFTKEITKKLDEVKKIKIIEKNERDLIVNTLEYFKEVSISYSSKSGDILSNLNMQIEVCKEIFKYIDMKKQPNMLTRVKMTMSLKLKVLKEEARLKQYLHLDLNIFKNLEKLKEEMKVLVAYEQVDILTKLKPGEDHSHNKSTNLLSLDEILKLLKDGKLTVEMFNNNRILTDDEYKELRGLYRIKRLGNDENFDMGLLLKILEIIDNRYDFNLLTKIHSVDVVGIDNINTLDKLYEKITLRDLNILRKRYTNDKDYFKHLKFLDKQIMNKIEKILDFEEKFSPKELSSEELSSEESSSGGRKVLSIKKEISGKLRCIYKIPGSRKEHIKYKRRLITVTEYKKLMKAKS
jgi:hypothetical protein